MAKKRRGFKTAVQFERLPELIAGKRKIKMGTGEIRKVVIQEMKPQIRTKSLVIKGQAYGEKLYALTFVIYRIDYSLDKDSQHPLTVTTGDYYNPVYYMAPVDISNTFIQARCTCPDYYFTWAWWNYDSRNLAGPRFPPYVRKTTWWPERNPCFTGDTRVCLTGKKKVTMEELAKNYKDRDFWVCSYKDGEFIPARGMNPRITGYENRLIRVGLDDGSFEDCTRDHLWMTKDGSYVRAMDLREGLELMSVRKQRRVETISNILKAQAVPVYDIEVEETHNFALASGSIVHNSHTPGLCKHLISFVQRLKADGIIRGPIVLPY